MLTNARAHGQLVWPELEYVELPWVKSLTQLVEIDLSSNLLSEIPDLSLPLLTRMDLQSNRLTAFESHARIHYDVRRNPKIDHATLRYDERQDAGELA